MPPKMEMRNDITAAKNVILGDGISVYRCSSCEMIHVAITVDGKIVAHVLMSDEQAAAVSMRLFQECGIYTPTGEPLQ